LRFWNIPYFPTSCSDPDIQDREKFPTVARVMPSYNKLGGAVCEFTIDWLIDWLIYWLIDWLILFCSEFSTVLRVEARRSPKWGWRFHLRLWSTWNPREVGANRHPHCGVDSNSDFTWEAKPCWVSLESAIPWTKWVQHQQYTNDFLL
jgi:hypothetical protein